MKTNKIRPRFHFFDKNKMSQLDFVLLLLSLCFLSNLDAVLSETVNHKTKPQGESFTFPFLSKNGI